MADLIRAAREGAPLETWVDQLDGTWARKLSTTAPVGGATAAKQDTIITLLGSSVATQLWKSYNATVAKTGEAVWTPAAGKKIAITSLVASAYGSTEGRGILWFGASADTTFNEGATDQPVMKVSYAPASTGYPGVVLALPTPILCQNADYLLRWTCSTNLSIDIVVYGYEFS